MKKLILLAASAIVGFGANAQNALPSGTNAGAYSVKEAVSHEQVRNHNYSPTILGKSTAGGSRWYNHAAVIDALTGAMDFNLLPIWFDSTVRQNFVDGLGTINFSSMGQVIDPIHFKLYRDTTLFDAATTIDISATDAYSIDSVSFSGAYVINSNRPNTIVDTFILSVSSTDYPSYKYGYNHPIYGANANPPRTPQYLPVFDPNSADTSLLGFSINDIDSINRASLEQGYVTWKVPIDSSMRQLDSAGFVDIQSFTFPVMVGGVPGSASIPAGRGAWFSVTFKTGDVVPVPNVDTFSEYHHFSGYTGEGLGAGQAMPYYYYSQNDRNASNLMFSTDTSRYVSSVIVEMWNTNQFRQEFHDMSVHITCGNCKMLREAVSVENMGGKVVAESVAYPNPANDAVTIGFVINQSAPATVTLTNAVGQVIASEKVSNVVANRDNKVTFSTSNLATGIYFYTIEANGQRTTNRFVVSH